MIPGVEFNLDPDETDLDAKLAINLMGIVPCAGWLAMHLGNAGGPALLKECDHKIGECYPIQYSYGLGGKFGGPPSYSTNTDTALKLLPRIRERTGGYVEIVGPDIWRVTCNVPGDEFCYTDSNSMAFAIASVAEMVLDAYPDKFK